MLYLYYTNMVLFWLSLPISNPWNPSLVKHLDKHDLQYLPQEVCIAQCMGRRRTPKAQTTTLVPPPLSSPPPVALPTPLPQLVLLDPLAPPTSQFLSDAKPHSPDSLLHMQIFHELKQKSPIEHCVEYCNKRNSFTYQNSTTVKQIHENFGLNLICRDESSLNFRINLHTTHVRVNHSKQQEETDVTMMQNTTATDQWTDQYAGAASTSSMTTTRSVQHADDDVVIFVIKILLANDTDKYKVYLSDDEFFTLDHLLPNTTYNVTAFAVHSRNQYSVIALGEQFQTLRRGYSPGNITNIKVVNFMEDALNPTHLSASVIWKPPADMTCYYDVICFSPISNDFEMQPVEIRNPRQLYKYQLDNLTFSTQYKVGIRAKNVKNMKESELFWKTFYAPSCGEWHNYNFNVCAPDAPENVQYQLYYVAQNLYSLNISWNRPTHNPDNYTLSINDLSQFGQVYYFNISKNVNNFFIDEIQIYSAYFDVILTASTVGGNATSLAAKNADAVIHIPEKNHFVKLFVVILAPIFCVAILSMTIFMIYHRRAKLKRYQERCKYFEELEKKAPIDPKDNFDFSTSLNVSKHGPSNVLHISMETDDNLTTGLFNDEMEIERGQLTLYEVLGEGAFGLVKRGIYRDNRVEGGAVHEVAVKMLKDHPNADDVRAFRREIEVMKSVEKHPNIVGILGHCTRFSNEMMLLTEYCSFGNLLDFLRDEWRFLHEIQQKKQKLNPTMSVNVELPQVLVAFDGRERNGNTWINSYAVYSSSPPYSPPPPPPIPTQTQTPVPQTISSHSIHFNSQQSPNRLEEFENIKNSQQQLTAIVKGDKTDVIGTNHSQIVIEHIQRRYNSFGQQYQNREKPKGSTGNDNGPPSQMQDFLLIHQNPKSTTSISPVTSPAAENKSYGYHGCCTNSCKCNVDVIIRNIDSSDSSREQDELDRLLQQQQHQQQVQHPTSYQQNFHKMCGTKIAIKNCDCRRHADTHSSQPDSSPPPPPTVSLPSSPTHKQNTTVDNKEYFKIFNDNNRQLTLIREGGSIRSTNTRKSKTNVTDIDSTSTIINQGALTNSLAESKNRDEGEECENDDKWCQRVPLMAEDLLDIARQVAVGMDFLSKNKVVHRDLAARNVLVAPDRTIKIADFGLSRDVYQENIYKKTGNGKLPIKWLALESLTHQVYTTQSDVWAYGILLYEIVTLGATPYPSIPTNRLLHLLKTGYRMEKPKNCGNEFYALMFSCWNGVPNERPTFSDIVKTLDDMLCMTTTPAATPTATGNSIKPLPSILKYPQSPIERTGLKKDVRTRFFCKDTKHNDNTGTGGGDDDDADDDDNDAEHDNIDKQGSPVLQICPDDSYLNPLT